MCLFELVQNWTWGTVPDWLIVLINVGIVFILWQHLKAFRFQADKLAETVKKMEESEKRATASDISNRESRQQELRAYIHIPENSITGEYDGINISITIMNFGKTPAYKTRIWNECEILPVDSNPSTEKPEYGNGELSIGPGQQIVIHTKLKFTEEERLSIENGSKLLFVWGRIDYLDAFEKFYRSTRFQFIGKKQDLFLNIDESSTLITSDDPTNNSTT